MSKLLVNGQAYGQGPAIEFVTLSKQLEKLEEHMINLYLFHCLPVVCVSCDIKVSYRWTSDEAEKLYNKFRALYRLIREERDETCRC